MKTEFEKLASPYLDAEMELVTPAEELSAKLGHTFEESLFASLAAQIRITEIVCHNDNHIGLFGFRQNGQTQSK